MKVTQLVSHLLLLTVLAATPSGALGQEVVSQPPPPQAQSTPTGPAQQWNEPCPKGARGGAVAGIVVGSVFWWVLPMSIPVLITQSKKLRAHNNARDQGRCQYARDR